MSINIRNTKSGRTILEMDGCSDYYGGALVQGNIICKISIPASVVAEYKTYHRMWERELARDAHAGDIKGAIVYEYRIVQ